MYQIFANTVNFLFTNFTYGDIRKYLLQPTVKGSINRKFSTLNTTSKRLEISDYHF